MQYLFPFSDIPYGSHIILYGAGSVGYDFYRQIKSSKYCHIVKWVDKQYWWYRKLNLRVDQPEAIIGETFDFVVIAANNKETYQSIKLFLTGAGIHETAIYWNENYLIKPGIGAKYNKNRILQESESAFLFNPRNCLFDNRLDLVVRVIYAKSFFQRRLSPTTKSLYTRLIMALNQGEEPVDDIAVGYFTDYEYKKGVESFLASFNNLLVSMKRKGFQREKFLPLDSKGRLCNGAHRCAAAIALNIDAWGYRYEFDGFFWHYNREWLLQNGFFVKEVNMICDIYDQLTHSEDNLLTI